VQCNTPAAKPQSNLYCWNTCRHAADSPAFREEARAHAHAHVEWLMRRRLEQSAIGSAPILPKGGRRAGERSEGLLLDGVTIAPGGGRGSFIRPGKRSFKDGDETRPP
jgi:hypothetical protein